MSNFLRGLGQVAGVAGKAIQGYGIDRENKVKQAMLKAREDRDAEQQRLQTALLGRQLEDYGQPPPETFGQPVGVTRGGKPAMIRVGSRGGEQVLPDTAPYEAPPSPRNLDPNDPEVAARRLADQKALATHSAGLRPQGGDPPTLSTQALTDIRRDVSTRTREYTDGVKDRYGMNYVEGSEPMKPAEARKRALAEVQSEIGDDAFYLAFPQNKPAVADPAVAGGGVETNVGGEEARLTAAADAMVRQWQGRTDLPEDERKSAIAQIYKVLESSIRAARGGK